MFLESIRQGSESYIVYRTIYLNTERKTKFICELKRKPISVLKTNLI